MKKNQSQEEFIKGIWRDNPVFVQVLGMCPMLAVTNSAINAVAMGMATFFVLVGSSFLVSTFRHLIPKQVRISCFIIIIATAFIPLIVANCLILGRQEAFASKHPTKLAVMDAVGMASGFMLALFSLGAVREILGDGALFGINLFGENFEPWVIMILPPGGFLTLGVILLFFNWFKYKKDEFLEDVAAAERSGN
jgi:electron transport complex protein RnfE